MKQIIPLLLAMALLLTACGDQEPVPEEASGPQSVRLTVWGAGEDEALM